MLNDISIKNFKALKNLNLPLTNLNIFAGLNGSGKSSFIQSLLLLRQSFHSGITKRQGLIIKDGELINLGKGKDIFYQYAEE